MGKKLGALMSSANELSPADQLRLLLGWGGEGALSHVLSNVDVVPADLIDGVISLVVSRDPMVAVDAIDALGRTDDLDQARTAAIDALWEASSSGSHLVRAAVAENIEYLDDRAHRRELESLVDDRHWMVRAWAIGSFTTLYPKRAGKVIARRLSVEGSLMPRASCLASLFRLGKKGVLPELIQLLRSRNYRVRIAVSRYLCEALLKKGTRREVGLGAAAIRQQLEREPTRAAEAALNEALAELMPRGGSTGG